MRPVWRVRGADFQVDAFLREFAIVGSPRVWHRGDPTRRGPAVDSGFTVRLPEADDVSQVIEQVRAYFAQCTGACRALRSRGVASTLDIGVAIDLPHVVARLVRVEAADLRWLADTGLDLELSVYAASDE